jgi:nucleotide-binding universal stress UspA family protein
MFTQIMVAFDGSDHAKAAIRAACNIAQKYGASLHLVHVPQLYDQAFAMGYPAMMLPVTMVDIQDSGSAMIAEGVKVAAEAGMTFASTNILTGPPADAILTCAQDKGADLIVSGRRGLGQFRSLMMGSISQSLSSLADCAVLTVK